MKRFSWVFVVGLLVGLGAVAQKGPDYYLVGNLEDVWGAVATDQGHQEASFFGSIGFHVVKGEEDLLIYLSDFNLVSKGVAAMKGETGLIGLRLADDQGKSMSYDPGAGRGSLEFSMVLHYQLIDSVFGFTEGGTKGEMDMRIPHTEMVIGKLSIWFPEGLTAADGGSTGVELEGTLELSSPVLGAISTISYRSSGRFDWAAFRPAHCLRIQPVFIGTGPTDSTATGSAFPELMGRAIELWNRCGSVQCVNFVVNEPRYINNPAYKVLETEAEADSLIAEVSVANAVEVFVVERMDFVCDWGGGICFNVGSASAKIVSCDQQLSVPNPCPCSDWCPATCFPCPPCQIGDVNYYHLAHELGHALNLDHPGFHRWGLAEGVAGSNMEPSGFCCDNPNVQSARNCRNATSPLMFWGDLVPCFGVPDIMD